MPVHRIARARGGLSDQRAWIGEPGEASGIRPRGSRPRASASRGGLARHRERRPGQPLRAGLPRPPPATLPLLRRDPGRRRCRPGRPAGDDGVGAARPRRRAPPDRARPLALPDRAERVAGGASQARASADRPRRRPVAAKRSPRRCRRRRRRPSPARSSPRRSRDARGAAAQRARDARARRARLRRDRRRARLLGGRCQTSGVRGAGIAGRIRRRARARLRSGPARNLGSRRAPAQEPDPAKPPAKLRRLLAVPGRDRGTARRPRCSLPTPARGRGERPARVDPRGRHRHWIGHGGGRRSGAGWRFAAGWRGGEDRGGGCHGCAGGRGSGARGARGAGAAAAAVGCDAGGRSDDGRRTASATAGVGTHIAGRTGSPRGSGIGSGTSRRPPERRYGLRRSHRHPGPGGHRRRHGGRRDDGADHGRPHRRTDADAGRSRRCDPPRREAAAAASAATRGAAADPA